MRPVIERVFHGQSYEDKPSTIEAAEALAAATKFRDLCRAASA